MIGYPLDELFREVAFIAHSFGWPRAEIMALEHRERRQWVAEISRINEEVARDAQEVAPAW